MNIVTKLKEATVPSLYGAGASVLLYYLAVDGNLTMSIPVGSMSVPVWGAIAGSSFIAAEISYLVSDYLIDKIPMLKDFEGLEKTVVPATVSGVSTYFVMRSLISPDVHLRDSFIVGAGGQFIGATAYNML